MLIFLDYARCYSRLLSSSVNQFNSLYYSPMFTEAEINVIDRFKKDFSKVAYNQLKKIKERYDETELQNKDCGCSLSRRKIWITNFYEWYEKEMAS